MNKESNNKLKGISQKNLYNNFENIDINIFKKHGLSEEDIEWIKRRITKNPKGFLFDFKELDKNSRLTRNYFVFKEIENLAINKKDKNNHLLIEGDNYEALKALKATKTKVDVIYIDPPYNTGKEFVYSDDYSTNSKPVSNDDIHKHSKWLSFMKKRLELARELLNDKGVIFVSIDDHEQAYLKVLMDEIFGEHNFIANLNPLDNLKGKANDKFISMTSHYIITYVKNKNVKKTFNQVKRNDLKFERKYNKVDENGNNFSWMAYGKTGADKEREKRKTMWFPVIIKNKEIYAIEDKEYNKLIKEGDFDDEFAKIITNKYEKNGYKVIWPKSNNIKTRWTSNFKSFKNFIEKKLLGISSNDSIVKKNMPSEIEIREKSIFGVLKNNFYMKEFSQGTNQLKDLGLTFNNPKSTFLIKFLLKLIDKNSLILDFFAGSGTTGHAVMELNKEDNGNRRFILITNNERIGYDTKSNPEYGIARSITRERIFRVIKGEGSNGEKIKLKTSLTNNSLNYLKVKTISKVNDEFEDIDKLQPLYRKEFNQNKFSIMDLENE